MSKFFILIVLGLSFRLMAVEPIIPLSPLIENTVALTSQDEMGVINNLIASTQAQLEKQLILKKLMADLSQQEASFAGGLQTKGHTAKMVRTARQILEMITDMHIQHMFPAQYLEQLNLFSSIAGRTSPARP